MEHTLVSGGCEFVCVTVEIGHQGPGVWRRRGLLKSRGAYGRSHTSWKESTVDGFVFFDSSSVTGERPLVLGIGIVLHGAKSTWLNFKDWDSCHSGLTDVTLALRNELLPQPLPSQYLSGLSGQEWLRSRRTRASTVWTRSLQISSRFDDSCV